MRGKGRFCMMQLTQCGITPAYAGKSTFNFRIMFRHEDHPRLCGEKGQFAGKVLVHGGSPPPMRGKAKTN